MITIKAKTALVTGSSRGIGTAAAVSERGAEVKLVQADVTRPDEITRMFKDVREEFGSLDILVSNARPDVEHFYQPAFDIPLENWQKALDSQALAMLVSVREAVPIMSDGGRILAVTYATGGRTGSWQPWVAMGAAKAAMESLCRYFAVALAPRGITVNMISPGATEDSVFSTLPPTVLQMIRGWAEAGWVPMRRLTTPADVGAVAALLCTEEAGFVTGQLIYVDGGASLMSADFPLDLQKG